MNSLRTDGNENSIEFHRGVLQEEAAERATTIVLTVQNNMNNA